MSSYSNRYNLIILFISLVVVMLGFGIIIPILPFYEVYYVRTIHTYR